MGEHFTQCTMTLNFDHNLSKVKSYCCDSGHLF